MSRYISKLFNSDIPTPQKAALKKQPVTQADNKKLPPNYAEQILVHDISLVLSDFSNTDSLHSLVQLYMKGVEYYEALQDQRQEYFKRKLYWLMSHPSLLQQSQEKTKQQLSASQQEQQIIKTMEKAPISIQNPQRQVVRHYSMKSQDPLTIKIPIVTEHHHMPTIQSVLKEDDSISQCYDNMKNFDDMQLAVKQEIYLQDDKKQVKDMMENLKQESAKIQEIIQVDIENQTKNISSRLQQRSTRKLSMSRASSQPVLEKLGFNHRGIDTSQHINSQDHQFFHVSVINEEKIECSQNISRRQSKNCIEQIIF